ncbi:MAG: alpha-L-glutamate ligase-like protein [Leptospira sp.]|nr:alpha-L-glutamate ligase-like protein [Leptospira sp.]
MISIFRKYKEFGILGINQRVGEFILPKNPRKYFPLVDDKWKTFELAKLNSVPMPNHFGKIDAFGEVKKFYSMLDESKSFVIKPANGGMGNGILVIQNSYENSSGIRTFEKSGGKLLSEKEIRHHISGILSGLYSLDGNSDTAILQEKLSLHPFFQNMSFQGIPDVRVIVYLGYPILAMLRLPTKDSGGRANLHQGAIGVGVDLISGTLTSAVHYDKRIWKHLDTGVEFAGLVLPFWKQILYMACRCYELSNLGYLGVDIVLDEKRGPILLEMNARPGLGIQIANLMGLLPRLKLVDQLCELKLSPEERAERMLDLLKQRLT